MIIPNFNLDINTKQQEWYRQYIIPLQQRVQSFIDYTMYTKPPYLVYGEEKTPYPDITTLKLKETFPFKSDTTKRVTLFYPSKLDFHHGFFNNESTLYTYLVYLEQDPNTMKNKYKLLNDPSFYFMIIKEGQETYVELYKDNQLYNVLPPTNFAIGYTCISNVQVSGADDDTNIKRNNLQNYLIIPMVSGGIYTWINQFNNTSTAILKYPDATWVKVKNNLSSSSLRFFLKERERQISKNSSTTTISEDSIQNHDHNWWLGNTVIPYTQLGQEECFTDIIYQQKEQEIKSERNYIEHFINFLHPLNYDHIKINLF